MLSLEMEYLLLYVIFILGCVVLITVSKIAIVAVDEFLSQDLFKDEKAKRNAMRVSKAAKILIVILVTVILLTIWFQFDNLLYVLKTDGLAMFIILSLYVGLVFIIPKGFKLINKKLSKRRV